MREQTAVDIEKKRDGVVVWDQRGLVVVWPDGHSQRFAWETLRHMSLCSACQSQPLKETYQETVFKHFS